MRLNEIQAALRSAGIDAWLFFDHHQRDPLAYHILGLPLSIHASRRWYYLVPASGDPVRLVHRIESGNLDALPGEKRQYSRWGEQKSELQRLLGGLRRVAMQYSPDCAVPYVSMVDGGTLELVRATGVEVVTSADLVQTFEATLSEEQRESHFSAGKKMDSIRQAAFAEIGRRLSSGRATTEWDIHSFIRQAYDREGLISPDGPIVGVNANASNPHYEPTGARSASIRPGDLVLIDMWSKLKDPGAVFYDITWTGFCGSSPRTEMQKVFEVVRDARNAGIERVKKGVSSGEELRGYQVDDATRARIESQGYGDYFVHRTGHSIGTDVHGSGANMDNFESHDERRVLARTLFSIEPGVYLPEFGVRSEINMYVGEREAVVTGAIQTELVRIDCGVS
jgi:Xaa-Pro dipeptidase